MRPSHEVLRAKRSIAGLSRQCNLAAHSDEPWAPEQYKTFLRLLGQEYRRRNAYLRAYLDKRARRATFRNFVHGLVAA